MTDCIGLYTAFYLLVVPFENTDSSNLCYFNCPIGVIYRTSPRYPETIFTTFFLKLRETTTTLSKKVGVCSIKIPNRLLQRLTWSVLQKNEFGLKLGELVYQFYR